MEFFLLCTFLLSPFLSTSLCISLCLYPSLLSLSSLLSISSNLSLSYHLSHYLDLSLYLNLCLFPLSISISLFFLSQSLSFLLLRVLSFLSILSHYLYFSIFPLFPVCSSVHSTSVGVVPSFCYYFIRSDFICTFSCYHFHLFSTSTFSTSYFSSFLSFLLTIFIKDRTLNL